MPSNIDIQTEPERNLSPFWDHWGGESTVALGVIWLFHLTATVGVSARSENDGMAVRRPDLPCLVETTKIFSQKDEYIRRVLNEIYL